MKILLINPPIRLWAKPNCFPTGLGYIAQALRKDHDIEVLDLNANRFSNRSGIGETEVYLAANHYNAIGITGLITNYKFVKNLIKAIKNYNPDIPIVVGGPLGTTIPEIMLRKAGADICVIGEGEDTAVELFRHLDNLNRVGGISYLMDGGAMVSGGRSPIQDISSLPLPAYDLFPTDVYAKNPCGSAINKAKWIEGEAKKAPRSMNILGSRGCPYDCIFCAKDFAGIKYRARSAESLMHEIDVLVSGYGVSFFLMSSDCFTINRRAVLDFCDRIKWRVFLNWECAARVDTVDEELLTKMKEAGCVMVDFGIESGSQKILDRLNKGVTVEQAHKAVELAQKVFGVCDTTFIIGCPNENKESIN